MLKRFLLVIAIGSMVLSLVDCKKDDKDPEPNAEEQQLAKLTTTWKCSNATLDGVTKDGYGDFKLIVNKDTYSCTGRPSLSPWPATGSWKFGTPLETKITRDSDLDVSYVVTDAQLTVTFLYTADGFSARTGEIHGQWVFTFAK